MKATSVDWFEFDSVLDPRHPQYAAASEDTLPAFRAYIGKRRTAGVAAVGEEGLEEMSWHQAERVGAIW
jgi:hypothetical protein